MSYILDFNEKFLTVDYNNTSTTTTEKCEDKNENGICDQDDEDDYDYDESDERKAEEDYDYDESDEAKAESGETEDDYDESDEQKAENENRTSTTTEAPKKKTKNDKGYEVTYHIYEEYMPAIKPQPIKREVPIVVQTIPHFSLNNFYGINTGHEHAKASFQSYPFPNLNPLVLYVLKQAPIYHRNAQHEHDQTHHSHPLPFSYHDLPRLYYEDLKTNLYHQKVPLPPPTTHIVNDHGYQKYHEVCVFIVKVVSDLRFS